MAHPSIDWLRNFDEALAESRNARKPVLIDICKAPCAGCEKLDKETFSNQVVSREISERFIAVKLDLFDDRRWVRPLNVFWTPTILFADRRGIVHYKSLNFLPPAEFVDLLDLGEAMTRMRWANYDRASELLAGIPNRNPDSPWAPEAIYRRGLVEYLQSNDNASMYEIWQELRDRFPDSIWTKRIP